MVKVFHYENLIKLCSCYGDGPLEETDGCVDQSLKETYVQYLINSAETMANYTSLMGMYYNGNDLPQDKSEALKCLDKAKEIGEEPRKAIFVSQMVICN